ncbi:MAG: Apolipoprotein N-acyltransferase [Chlamydiae bacterium]|nr:Apolipoprotein N-acyltransferase [Chlamydiota bacterium]
MDNVSPLSKRQKIILAILSFVIVAFGQPAWSSFLAMFAALFGFALFFRILLDYPKPKHRFWMATLWFSAVQMVQLSWSVSHPFYYIYAVYPLFCFGESLQFGILGLFFTRHRISKVSCLLVISAVWTLFEWSRLYFLSGYTWNPVGLSLAGNIFSLQAASLGGIFALSFWVILTNLFALRTWMRWPDKKVLVSWCAIAVAPYLFGAIHYTYHNHQMNKLLAEGSNSFSTVLVQTAFPVEEMICFKDHNHYREYVLDEWRKILQITKKQKGRSIQLIALPEFVVPFGTYTFVYPYEKVEEAFSEIYGKDSIKTFPPLDLPLAYQVETENEKQWMVNNAFWAQAIANYFDSGLVIGLEDAEDVDGDREYYSSAIYIEPTSRQDPSFYQPPRYAKRVLVPMGEYIPFNFCKDLAASYGIVGSFTAGKKAEVWECDHVPFGVSICYDETFGDMMRENKRRGAKILLNLSSDAWFPHSRLIVQHLEHARLRTVENGIPLIRSCNTGVTCAVDSLGRDIASLGGNDDDREDISDSLFVQVPMYTYETLYSRLGDGLIVGFSMLVVLLFFRLK